jgi:hypothetical protein
LVRFTNVPEVNEDTALPEDIPDRPVTTGALHVYVVPDGTTLPFDNEEVPLGDTVNAVPLQIAAGV